jgi:HlyD family secretion protein
MKSINKVALMSLAMSAVLISCKKSNDEYDASGTFETVEVIVSSEASGKILTFNVEEGQIVKQNERLGLIDSTQLYLRKEQLLATGQAIQSRRPDINKQIAAIQEQIQTQKTERRRVDNLLKANAANKKQLDDINAQLEFLQKQLDAQKSTLETGNRGINNDTKSVALQVEQTEDQIKKCYISSPINGTVLVKYAQTGEVAMPGKALFKVADTNNMILRAYVTADQLNQLKIGQSVRVFADFGTDKYKEYPGTLTWIASKAEFTPKTIQTRDERANLVYAVKISVKNDGYLKIGMYGEIKLK